MCKQAVCLRCLFSGNKSEIKTHGVTMQVVKVGQIISNHLPQLTSVGKKIEKFK
jgi:hypothetical protein